MIECLLDQSRSCPTFLLIPDNKIKSLNHLSFVHVRCMLQYCTMYVACYSTVQCTCMLPYCICALRATVLHMYVACYSSVQCALRATVLYVYVACYRTVQCVLRATVLYIACYRTVQCTMYMYMSKDAGPRINTVTDGTRLEN